VNLQRGPAALLAVGGGLVVATQARVNGEFGQAAGHPAAGALLTAATGLLILTVVAALARPVRSAVLALPGTIRSGALPWWALLVGTFGGIILLSQTVAVPSLGVAVYSVIIVTSLTAAGLLVDRAGLGPAGVQALTRNRLAGAGLAGLAAVVAAGPDVAAGSFALAPAAVTIAAGAGGATQSALLGRLGVTSGQPIAAMWVNYAGATLTLAVLLAALTAHGASWGLPALSWLWLGGPLGLLIVGSIVVTVPRAGVLVVTLALTAGQLVGSLLWDWAAPVAGRAVDPWAIAGAVLLMAAVTIAAGVGGAPRRRG